MEFSAEQLVELVERASTLAERLGPAFQPKAAADNERRIKARLEQWRQVCAYGDQAKFERRLAWDGLDIDRVSPFLGAVRWVSEQPLPAWTETLQAALRQAQDTTLRQAQDTTLRQAQDTTLRQAQDATLRQEARYRGEIHHQLESSPDETPPVENRPRYLEPETPLPFEELLVSFVEVARQKLRDRAGSAYSLLSDLAHEALERNLLTELSLTCALTFNLEFSIFRMLKNSSAFQPWGGTNGTPSRALYQEFVREMLDGKLLTFFQSYSVLARLAATLTDLWVDANLEFLQRLAADWPDIQQTFQAERELGQVMMVQPALSDRHHQGRRVIALKFASGQKLVYKPRSLGLEGAYFQLLAWLNERGTPLPFKVLEVLDRGAHGWVEYVAPKLCQDEAEASRYYRRAGMLLAILYTIEATDCHFQNIIADGEQPVLIDVEGLMQHQIRWPTSPGAQATDAHVLARQRLLDSVLRTSFLPRWEFGPNGQEAYDLSGLGAVGEQALNWQTTRLYQVNTDGMALVHEAGAFESYANSPLPKGVDLAPGESNALLTAGFAEMYQFLITHRDALLASDGPLSIFARQWTRLILRNTRGYEAILRKSIQPNFLRNGAERSLQLDILSRWMLSFGQKPACWPLLALEQQALAHLDIPHFSAPAGGDALPLPDGPDIEKFFVQASYERVLTRVEQLGETDLERQLEYIAAALYTRLAGDPHGERPAPPLARPEPDRDTIPSLAKGRDACTSRMALIQQAAALADWLHGRAITTAGGHSAAWIGLQYTPEMERYQLQPLSYDLYSGGGGIALFLAGLARVTGEKGYHQAALSAVHPLRQVLYDMASPEKIAHPEQVIKGIGLGGASGVGSFLYVLTQVGQLLAEPALLVEARQAAAFVSPALIAADERYDVMLGAAGMILSLLSLYRASGDKTVLTQAGACGQHLLDKQVASPDGPRAWPTLQGKFLTGFAHGAAGIAYALLRLSEEISKTETPGVCPTALRDAAAEAIAYERNLFSLEHGNWPDLRKSGPEAAFGLGWCHGAPGIGLARLGGLAGLDTPEIRQDITVALQTTQQASLAGLDHLCCGNFGRLELLLVAACQLSNPELHQTAQQQAAQIVTRAGQKGAFSLSNSSTCHPGFFQGVAGIGYGLLRLAEPELLPSVLLWA